MSKIGLMAALGLMLAVALAFGSAMGTGASPAEAQTRSSLDSAVPRGLSPEYVGGWVLVSWFQMPASATAGHDLAVYRRHISGPCPCEQTTLSLLTDLSGQPFAARDNHPVSGATYEYWAEATERGDDEPGATAATKRVSYHISPQPHSLRAYPSAAGDGGVYLRWTPGAHPKYTQQIVRRRAAGSSTWTETVISATTVSYTDTTAEPGVKYSYRIKAAKANGKGGQTARVKITAP